MIGTDKLMLATNIYTWSDLIITIPQQIMQYNSPDYYHQDYESGE